MDSKPATEGKVPSETVRNPAKEKEAGTQDSRTISQFSELLRWGLETQKTESLRGDRPGRQKHRDAEAHFSPNGERQVHVTKKG